jgi:glycosyltransferase involved in cell wall biosynthesis
MARICLSMIVKNESHVILECLNSVHKLIDYWVIVDTGSTDGTQDIIRKFFEEKGIPGELHEREWKGFGKSRTEALQLCKDKADYAYMIDADDYLQGQFKLPHGTEIDSFALRLGREEFSWWRNQIFSMKEDWEYVGILHEYPRCVSKPQPVMSKLEGNYRVVARTMGARNVGITPIEKYSKDAEALEQALIDEPDNSRYQFYLGQSYFDSQQWEKAITAYEKRVNMGGWPEEVYYSIYRIAIAKSMLNHPWHEIMHVFLTAYQYRPMRAEPLYHIAQIYRTKLNMPAVAYTFAKAALDIPFPVNDILFVPDAIYKFGILDEVCATAAYAGQPFIGYSAGKRLLEENKIPPTEIERIQTNMKHYEEILKQHQEFLQQQEQKAKQEQIAKEEKKKKKKFKARK